MFLHSRFLSGINKLNFFISKLNENKIEVVYTINPFQGEHADDILKSISDKNCVKKTVLTSILNRYLIHKCNDLLIL